MGTIAIALMAVMMAALKIKDGIVAAGWYRKITWPANRGNVAGVDQVRQLYVPVQTSDLCSEWACSVKLALRVL